MSLDPCALSLSLPDLCLRRDEFYRMGYSFFQNYRMFSDSVTLSRKTKPKRPQVQGLVYRRTKLGSSKQLLSSHRQYRRFVTSSLLPYDLVRMAPSPYSQEQDLKLNGLLASSRNKWPTPEGTEPSGPESENHKRHQSQEK